jgi:hypothetical protein
MMLLKTFTLAAIAGLVIAVPTPAKSGGTDVSVPQPPTIAAPVVPVPVAETQDDEENLQDLKEIEDFLELSSEEIIALESIFQDEATKETDIATRSSGHIERRFFGKLFKNMMKALKKILKGKKGGRSLAARRSDDSDEESLQDLQEVAALLGLSSEEVPELEAALQELAQEQPGIAARGSGHIERRFFGALIKLLPKLIKAITKGIKKGGK